MTELLRFVFLLFAVICVTAVDKKEEHKSDMAARQESPAEAKKINKSRLAKILDDFRALDHHDKKLRRILMKGGVLRKLNKALKKEGEKKMGHKNIVTQLRTSDVKNRGKNSELNMHELKRFVALNKLARAFDQAEIKLEEKSATKGKSDEKKLLDEKAQKVPEPQN